MMNQAASPDEAAGLRVGRRALLARGGAVAGLGLAAGAALSRGLASLPASAATTSFSPIEPSGDTSGATDWNAIQSVLNAGQGAAAWLAGGTFYVNQTITFKMSQQSILGQGRRVTKIVAADGFTRT
jgi:hypothetical protein